MRHTLILLLLIFGVLTACDKSKFKYPKTKKEKIEDVYFSTVVSDPYRWLENDTSVETAEWVTAQNEVTFTYLEKIKYREKIKERMESVWNYPRQGVPFKRGGWYTYLKNNGLQNQDVLYGTHHLDSSAVALIDPNTMAEDGTIGIYRYTVSDDGKYIVYSISKAGSDWTEILVKDLESGKQLEDHLEWIKFSDIAWFEDGFFYSRYEAPKEGNELSGINKNHTLYYHKVGTKQSKDDLIYVPETPDINVYASTTDDGKYLVIYEMESTHGNILRIKNLQNEKSPIIQLTQGFDYEYWVVGNIDDHLYVLTNYNAPNYRLVKININSLEIGNWENIIPPSDVLLEKCIMAGGNIIACFLKDAKSVMKIYDLKGSEVTTIELPGIGTVKELSGKLEDDELFYSFNSFTQPSVVYKYDINTKTTSEIFIPQIDFDLNAFETQQVFYESKDGTRIPMFIVYKKGIKKDGGNPVLLYGYGGFNVNMTPRFIVSLLVWLENGGVYAMPNIRGGGEYGENWHKAGTQLNKQNVFDDFISAAEYLISENYTQPGLLAIHGSSNGGLLIGAVTNQRPELFRVALPDVGVMDMLRYQYFTIGRKWAVDYGTSEDSVMFEYLYKYSPLHTIKEDVEYPAVLVTTADHDDRVVPAHSFKYIATLQDKYKGDNPVMIRVQTNAGHGGTTPTSMIIEEMSDMWSFVFYNMNITPIY